MATEKIASKKSVSSRSPWQLSIRTLFVGTVVAAFAVFLAKDIDYSIFMKQSRPLPVFPPVRLGEFNSPIPPSQLLPPEIEKKIKQSMLKKTQVEEQDESSEGGTYKQP